MNVKPFPVCVLVESVLTQEVLIPVSAKKVRQEALRLASVKVH